MIPEGKLVLEIQTMQPPTPLGVHVFVGDIRVAVVTIKSIKEMATKIDEYEVAKELWRKEHE